MRKHLQTSVQGSRGGRGPRGGREYPRIKKQITKEKDDNNRENDPNLDPSDLVAMDLIDELELVDMDITFRDTSRLLSTKLKNKHRTSDDAKKLNYQAHSKLIREC